jgi:hypothetical protein
MLRFTRDWGYDDLLLGNLYAFIAMKPADLWAHLKAGGNIVGPDTDSHLNHTYALGFTKSGQPAHPLRQLAELQLIRCDA